MQTKFHTKHQTKPTASTINVEAERRSCKESLFLSILLQAHHLMMEYEKLTSRGRNGWMRCYERQ